MATQNEITATQIEMDAELEISRIAYEKAENEAAERDHLAMQAELEKDYAEYNDRENAHQQSEYEKILVRQEAEHNKKMDHYYKYGY